MSGVGPGGSVQEYEGKSIHAGGRMKALIVRNEQIQI